MKEYVKEKTQKTPYINFNLNEGSIEISGRSIPENPESFYSDLFTWLDEYTKSPGKTTVINIQLEYINSGSSKFILEFFQQIQEFYQKGNECKINWYYEEDDEAVLELGKHYQSILNVPVHLIEIF